MNRFNAEPALGVEWGSTADRLWVGLNAASMACAVTGELPEAECLETWTLDRARFEVGIALLESGRVAL